LGLCQFDYMNQLIVLSVITSKRLLLFIRFNQKLVTLSFMTSKKMSEETILPSDQEKSAIRLPPPAKYTKLSEGSKEDFVNAQTYFALEASPKAQAKRSFCVEKKNSENSYQYFTLEPLQITIIKKKYIFKYSQICLPFFNNYFSYVVIYFDKKFWNPKRLIGLLESLKGVNIGNLIDLYEHSIQTATRYEMTFFVKNIY
jgi:hypothetical protein